MIPAGRSSASSILYYRIDSSGLREWWLMERAATSSSLMPRRIGSSSSITRGDSGASPLALAKVLAECSVPQALQPCSGLRTHPQSLSWEGREFAPSAHRQFSPTVSLHICVSRCELPWHLRNDSEITVASTSESLRSQLDRCGSRDTSRTSAVI